MMPCAQVGAEDQSRPGVPSRWAYIIGVSLPRVLQIGAIDFRAEFANNHQPTVPDFWYNHSLYTQGYTDKCRAIGHHMGTDSRDLFLESSFRLPGDKGKVSIHYDREEHNLSGDAGEKKDEVGVEARRRFGRGLEAAVTYRYARLENEGNIPGRQGDMTRADARIYWRF